MAVMVMMALDVPRAFFSGKRKSEYMTGMANPAPDTGQGCKESDEQSGRKEFLRCEFRGKIPFRLAHLAQEPERCGDQDDSKELPERTPLKHRGDGRPDQGSHGT